MTMQLYSVYDKKSEVYANPFVLRNNAEALRGFATACNDPKTMMHSNPEDFELVVVGGFNPETGEIIASQCVVIGQATEYKQVQQ